MKFVAALVLCFSLVGCAQPKRMAEETWTVVKGKDPMNDAEICRVMGQPTAQYIMSVGRTFFKIGPMVERYGSKITAGFTSLRPGLDAPPPGANFNSVEYRFDSNAANSASTMPAATVLVSDTSAFIEQLQYSEKLIYRINGRSLIEFKLSGVAEKLAECGIDVKALAANIDLNAVSSATTQNINNKSQKPILGVNLQELPNALIDGILVISVFPNTPAARVGLVPGDFITAVNGKPVSDLKTFISLLPEQTGIPTSLQVRRISGAMVELHPDL